MHKPEPIEEKELRQYDDIEQALAGRPFNRAPHNTASRLMATIASLPQETSLATFAPPAVQTVRYTPPAALPLPEAEEERNPLNRKFTRFYFTGAWLGACALFIYLIVWPGLSNLLLGGQDDMNVVTRLVQLGFGLVTVVGGFISLIAPLLPSLASALIGLLIMLLIFGTQRRRLRLE